MHSVCLKPWLSILVLDMAVSSEEGEVHSELVEHHEKVFGDLAEEAWYVCSTEGDTSVSKLQDHSE